MDFFGSEKGKIFFERLAARYPKQVALLDAGKLFDADGWGNIRRHCLVQAAAIEVLGDFLQLPAHDVGLMAEVAACHDYRKRADKRPGDFNDAELSQLDVLFAEADLRLNLLNSTNPSFIPRFVCEDTTVWERIQFIVDDMTGPDGTIVSFDQRVDEVSRRNPDPEPEIREQLGRSYWDVEREVGHLILTDIFVRLRQKGENIRYPSELSEFLNAGIAARIEATV